MESVRLLREWGFVVVIFVQKHKEKRVAQNQYSSRRPRRRRQSDPLMEHPSDPIYTDSSLLPSFFFSLFLLAFIRSSFLTRIPPTRRIVVRGKRREEEGAGQREGPLSIHAMREGEQYEEPMYIHIQNDSQQTDTRKKKSVAAQSKRKNTSGIV